jgi:hypothetical protein
MAENVRNIRSIVRSRSKSSKRRYCSNRLWLHGVNRGKTSATGVYYYVRINRAVVTSVTTRRRTSIRSSVRAAEQVFETSEIFKFVARNKDNGVQLAGSAAGRIESRMIAGSKECLHFSTEFDDFVMVVRASGKSSVVIGPEPDDNGTGNNNQSSNIRQEGHGELRRGTLMKMVLCRVPRQDVGGGFFTGCRSQNNNNWSISSS